MSSTSKGSFEIVANLVDVFTKNIAPACVEVVDGRIERIQPQESATGYLLPGFIDAHVHIESSMLLPTEFARVAVRHGTVATVSDPHEIANVCGLNGIELMLTDSEQTPFKFHFGAPSCVPATAFETTGAVLGPQEVAKLLDDPRINHLSEMMNFPGAIASDPEVIEKIAAAKARGLPIDGHAPGVRGDELTRYLAIGISTDHECVTLEEAEEKISKGCRIAIREGSAARNFDALWPLVMSCPDQCMFCSDDKHPDDLLNGHINELVVRALQLGCDLFDVLQVACVNPVKHYRLNVGLLRIGDPADFILVDELEQMSVRRTYINGCLVMADGESKLETASKQTVNNFSADRIGTSSIQVVSNAAKLRVVDVYDGQIITGQSEETVVVGETIDARPQDDLLKLAVLNRYQAAEPAVAFVRGCGLQRGAFASSVAHDSHNIVAIGTNDRDLVCAINSLVDTKGGLSVVDGDDQMLLPLPIAGLMSDKSCEEVARHYSRLDQRVKELGTKLSAPFMTLSFLALPVIPDLKLTDQGLFDVGWFGFVPLFIEG